MTDRYVDRYATMTNAQERVLRACMEPLFADGWWACVDNTDPFERGRMTIREGARYQTWLELMRDFTLADGESIHLYRNRYGKPLRCDASIELSWSMEPWVVTRYQNSTAHDISHAMDASERVAQALDYDREIKTGQ